MLAILNNEGVSFHSTYGAELVVLDGGKEHAATLLTAQALMGQHARGTSERKVAFRWCVGCIPREDRS